LTAVAAIVVVDGIARQGSVAVGNIVKDADPLDPIADDKVVDAVEDDEGFNIGDGKTLGSVDDAKFNAVDALCSKLDGLAVDTV
jgi:hypothetical protein